MNEEFYIAIICEIFNGYSEAELNGDVVFLKHPLLKDQQSLDIHYRKHYDHAKKIGVPSQEESLAMLKENDLWTDFDERKIASSKDEVENLLITKKSLPLTSQKKQTQERIDAVEAEISDMEQKRRELVGITAEEFARNRSHEQLLHSFVFKDSLLTTPYFSIEEFDDLESDELMQVVALKLELSQKISDTSLQEACLRPFFSYHLPFCETPADFFGSSIIDLTIHQLKLATFGRMFYSIFQYTEDIPDNIRDNPSKLMAFSEGQRNKGKGKALLKDDADGSMVFGANKEDMKEIQREAGGSVKLSKVLKEKGGKLNMEDMMKLSGSD